MFSQNKEEEYILGYFQEKGIEKGKFLEIGAYDGKTFSNVYALILKGWYGKALEPSPTIFPRLKENMKDFDVQLINKAIGLRDEFGVPFYDCDDAVGTFDEDHHTLWKNQIDYKQTKVDIISVETLFEEEVDYDMINLDVEGLNWEIFQELPFDRLTNLKLICVEHNNKINEMTDLISEYGFKEIHRNGENIIFVK